MKTDSIKCKVAMLWIVLGAAACLGAQLGPEEGSHKKTLNQSQPTIENFNLSPTRFKISLPEQSHSFNDYLHDISARINVNGSLQKQSTDDKSRGKVVVVARVRNDSKTNGEEWIVVAEPKNDDFNGELTYNQSQEEDIEYSLDYLLETEDIQKYVDDYENIFFSFKDLVKIVTNPSIKEKIDEKSSDQEIGKKFNVTYVMPIPNKNDNYFKIIIPNLTESQYDEINTLLQEHMQNKTNKTQVGIEAETMSYSAARGDKKHVTSRSLTDSSMLYAELEEQNSQMSLPSNLTDAIAFFQRELTEKGYSPLLHSLSSDLPKHFMNKTENKEPEATFVIRNNGLSIPVATDYKQNNLQDNTASNAKPSQDKSHLDPPNLNSNPQLHTLSNPLYTQRSITSQRSQRPQINQANSTKNRLRIRTNSPIPQTNTKTILSHELTTKNGTGYTSDNTTKLNKTDSKDMQHERATPNELPSNLFQLEDKSTERNTTNLQMNMGSQIPGVLNEIAKDHGNVNILQAANFILDMKKKLEEEERKKNERYKSYIKSYLRGDNSIFPMKSANGSVMKINKQDDILEELKLLMLDYFTFMNFNLFDPVGTNSSLAIESILNATDLFQLMERSSKLVKLNLQFKLQNESREPTGFVKKIVESQVEKCRELTTKLRQKVNRSNEPITKRTHKTYMVFTRCMNLKLTKCVRGFSIWLQRGKFFRRPQFNLNRAYENYETEKNLYCLRTHNALTSESNARGIKVKPRLKVNRKTGMRRKMKGGTKSSRAMRKMRNDNNMKGTVEGKKLKNQRQMIRKTSNDTQTFVIKSEDSNQEYSTNQSTSFQILK